MSQRKLKKTPDEFPFEINRHSVALWLQGLPLIDNKETCQLVYSTLRQLNFLVIAPKVRAEILEEYRPYVNLLADNLEKHFLGVSFPLEKSRRKLAKLSTQFHLELATAYITILGDAEQKQTGISNQRYGALIGWALEALYRSLVHIMLIYEPPSSRYWKKVFSLYKMAEKLNIQDALHPNEDDKNRCTIETRLKRILLLWLANPYRQKQGDIQQIQSLLDQFAHLAVLSNEKPTAPLDSICTVDLSRGLPPLHINSRMSNLEDSNLRFLDPQPLGLALLEQSSRKNSEFPLQTSRGLLMRLIKNFGIPEGRLQPREARDDSTEIVIGFSKIIALHQRENKKPEDINPNGTINWISDPNLDLLPMEKGQFLTPDSSRNRSEGPISQELYAFRRKITPNQIWENPSETDKPTRASTISHPCEIGNSSVKGYRIISASNENLEITVGELTALKHNGKIVEIGVVRWIQCLEESHVEFGLELLSKSITLAEAWFTGTPPKKKDVLFLDATADSDHPISVLIPAIRIRSGIPIKLKFKDKIVHFKLVRLLEMTSEFLHYSLLEHEKTKG